MARAQAGGVQVREEWVEPPGCNPRVILQTLGGDAARAQAGGAQALEEWVELANGCLCCSVKTEFVQALEALMQRRSRFDYILIETTGALPGLRAGARVAAVQPALWSLGHVRFAFRFQGARSKSHASAILASKISYSCLHVLRAQAWRIRARWPRRCGRTTSLDSGRCGMALSVGLCSMVHGHRCRP